MKKILTLLTSLVLLFVVANAQISNQQVIEILKQRGNSQLDANSIIINSQYTEKSTGITHVYFKQALNSAEVFNTQSSLHFDKNGNLFHSNINLASINNSKENHKLNAQQALQIATQHAGVSFNALGKTLNIGSEKSFKINEPSVSSEAITGKQVFYFANNELVPAWQVEVLNDESNDWLNILVDATNGEILNQYSYTTKCNIDEMAGSNLNRPYFFNFEDDNVSLGKGANDGTYNVFSVPSESPMKGKQELVPSTATSNGSPYGWHDTDGVAGPDFTITRGNNVRAKEDTANKNSGGYSPDGGTDLMFDYDFQTTFNPRVNLNASITNLFYMNNIMHDVLYNHGFNEVAGNFQANNYGKGGLALDAVNADAQDGSGTNNANFSTPVDGLSGRMQMYIWKVGGAARYLALNSPIALKRTYASYISNFGPKPSPVGVTEDVVLVNDSSTLPNDGCNALKNADQIAGKIALVYRGSTSSCPYIQKVKNAQNAGAIGVIIVHTGTPFGGASGTDTSIHIPSVLISKVNGDTIKNNLSNVVNATIYDSSTTKPNFDCDFDNGVIAHEYGHGISNRLTGGPANSSCLQNAEQAGEGWSDFFALTLTAREWETQLIGRGIGNYVNNQDTNGVGIRPFKYSRNLSVNPVKYGYLKTGGSTYTQVHGLGFVWCSMLYDMYLDMIDKYGFNKNFYANTGGNNIAFRLVVEGLKLQPCSPGFVDARNAILKADSILFGNANKLVIWTAFARRGLGYSASQGSSSSATDGVEAFDLPTGMNSVNEINNNSFKVFPNPSNGSFAVECDFNINLSDIFLYDLSGKQVSVSAKNISTNKLQIESSNLDKGVYILKINAGKQTLNYKVVVN